jgi:hypothetical protein
MVVNLAEISGAPVLAGAISGRAVLSALLSMASKEPSEPEPFFLNFNWVDVATASFLRESVLAFRNIIRSRRSNYYPVVVNAKDVVLDELEELVRTRSDIILTATLDEKGRASNFATVGQLDPKQKLTFDLVQSHGETDAGELMREYGKSEGTKHTTAWNNRLASLASLGLIVELSQGRAKRYKPLFEGA